MRGRVLFNSRGAETVEVDVVSGGMTGRACAPSGASVGSREAIFLPKGGAAAAVRALHDGARHIVGADAGDPRAVHDALRCADGTDGWRAVGGAVAYALTIAAAESAAAAAGEPLFCALGAREPRFPYPLGNILGGGAHAGPGTPDIQEILVCPVGAETIEEAVRSNLAVHAELGRILRADDPGFAGGRGDEGGWAPRADNERALELAARACESLGYTLGSEVALGVDFAASTQWDAGRAIYDYARARKTHTPGEQADFVIGLAERYKLAYVEDAVHEDAFEEMAEISSALRGALVTGDDLTVTSAEALERAADAGSCSAAILKVNQAGSLHDALRFAHAASERGIELVTSHRSGESTDSHISHIAVATRSRMIKCGIVGGERVAKLNELLRLSEQGLIRGMAGRAERT